MKHEHDKHDKKFIWTLLVEFNGLCAGELLCRPREMIVHLINDPMHVPALTVRHRDVFASHDCGPKYTILCRDVSKSDMASSSTVAVWPIVQGARMGLRRTDLHDPEIKRDAVIVDTNPAELDHQGHVKNPDSIKWLPVLGDVLGSSKCDAREDYAQFRLSEGTVKPGRLDPDRRWRITAGSIKFDPRPLGITLIYQISRQGRHPLALDLHAGMVLVGPPSAAKSGYMVELTVSNLPIAHHDAPHGGGPHVDHQPHFNEYNRLVSTDRDVVISESKTFDTVEDPIHCFGAAVLP